MRASAVKVFLATTRRAPPPKTTCGTVSSVTFPSPQAKNASTHSRRASFEEGRAGADAAAPDAGAAGFGAAGCPAAGDDASHPRAAASRAMTGSVTRDFMGRRLTSFAAGPLERVRGAQGGANLARRTPRRTSHPRTSSVRGRRGANRDACSRREHKLFTYSLPISNLTRTSPAETAFPAEASTEAMTPSRGDFTSFSIFIASRTRSG